MSSRTGYCFVPIISLIIVAVVFPFAAGIIPVVKFTSERIDVHVYPEKIVVDGHYFYKNPFPFPVVQGFFIPFPVDRNHPEPDEVYVERIASVKQPVVLKNIFGQTNFDVYFSAHDLVEVRVFYCQRTGGGKATYILTTTKPWGKPLESGIYTLYPHGTVIESSNYPFNLTDGRTGFHKTGFMPGKDWEFTWRRVYETRS